MNITRQPYTQAEAIIEQALKAQLAKGPTLLLLSGGSIATVYAELASTLELDLVPGQLVVGLADERYDLDPNHAAANDVAIRTTGLITRLEQQGAIYSPILHGHSLEEEALQYNYQLTQFMQHEHRGVVAILGVGLDGHIAGMLPDPDADRFCQRFEGGKLVCGYENDGPYPLRVTTTMTALGQFDQAIVIIRDETKLPMLGQAIDPQRHEPLNLMPAAILQTMPNVVIAAPQTANKETL